MQDSMPTTPSFTNQAIAIPPSHSLDVLDKIFQPLKPGPHFC